MRGAREPVLGVRESSTGRAPHRLVIQLGFLLLCLVWGSTWLVIREGLEDLPPFTSLAARCLLAGTVFLFVGPALARREGGERPTPGLTLLYALLILVVPYGIIYQVETLLPSGLVSVLWSIYPILLALSAHLLLPNERMAPRQWAGLVVGFLGVTAMFWTDVRTIGPEAVPAGLLLLLSPLSSAVATPYIKRSGRTSSALLNRNGLLLGAAILVPVAWWFERGSSVRWSGAAISSVAYLGLVGTVLAFGLYFWLLRHAPATTLGLIAFCVPVVALALGAFVGGEVVELHTVAGMLAILTGVGLVVLGKRRGPPTHPVEDDQVEAVSDPSEGRAPEASSQAR